MTKESSPLIDTASLSHSDDEDTSEYRTYRRRWYILAMFTVIALALNIDINTWGPISEACKILFGWENWQVMLASSWIAISFILSAAPSIWIMDTRGLRASVILCAFLLTAGKVFQVIPCSDPLTRTILLNIGQSIIMLCASILLGAPPLISATWFPPNERTTATAISTLVGYLGLAIGFIVGPNMVPVIPQSRHNTNTSDYTKHAAFDIETMSKNLTNYIGLRMGLSASLLICVLVYFPNTPPSPPSATSSCNKQREFKENIKKLLLDGWYIYLASLFAVGYGVYYGWMIVLALAVRPFGIDETLAGWIGMAATLAGICSGVCTGRVADYIKRHTKIVLILLFLGTSISQLLFALTCSRIIPFSRPLLFSSIILGGFFFTATTPLMFEMAVEAVYPIAEGVTTVLLLLLANIVFLAFFITFMFPSMDIVWMNWATVVSSALCVPGLLFYKNKFKRLELE